MKVDMSARAVTARLKLASELRWLCIELGKMKPVATAEAKTTESDPADTRSNAESQEKRDPSNQRPS